MNLRKSKRIQRSVERGKPAIIGASVLQTWYIVEKRVESPETDRIFSDVVGVLREKSPDMKMPYQQRPALVLTEHMSSRTGIQICNRSFGTPYMKHIRLCPIDFAHKVLGAWDDK